MQPPSTLSKSPRTASDDGIIQRDGRPFYRITGVERYAPFLVSLVSERDHWCFITSNGGMTAGRRSPLEVLFPYYTQDKLIDFADVSGPFTALRLTRSGDDTPVTWRALDPRSRTTRRTLEKSLDGTELIFTEECPHFPLTIEVRWGLSARFGFVREVTLRSSADVPCEIEVLDGWRNLQACGVSDAFQNELSNLVDAYRCAEHLSGTTLRLFALNSAPTDRAEPSESLRCTVAWSLPPAEARFLLSERQIPAFLEGETIAPESRARGVRAAALDHFTISLAPDAASTWTTVADVAQSTAQADRLRHWLETSSPTQQAETLRAEIARTREGLRAMVASADGLSLTADPLRTGRHYSNVMFNIMRGGVFLQQGRVARSHLVKHLETFHRPLVEKYRAWLTELPEQIAPGRCAELADATRDVHLARLARECLPLTFSRRHGDPSRPWNRFSIRVRDRLDQPVVGYEGNWRDIFQNWETLLHSFPAHLEGAIFRFLNATTADGFNPYRLTHEGFEWEELDPSSPWANIGYWGDHQIVYLLRLLEASRRFDPAGLTTLLARKLFVYAEIPYRLRSYEAMRRDPRETIDFDFERDAAIQPRVRELGADGRLLHTPEGEITTVNLFEKLLAPLLSKLAGYIPGAGIWMNTQRPEWNDANNALVGFGVSAVTLAYCHRYLNFLIAWWEGLDEAEVELSEEIALLLEAEAKTFATPAAGAVSDAEARGAVMRSLGEAVSRFRETLYDAGLSGAARPVALSEIVTFLRQAREAVAASLRANRRPDGLYHSYNLLSWEDPASDQIELHYLEEMLEGQVAILSAGLLSSEEVARLLTTLRHSRLFRADQHSYILYPDREIPSFLEKNRLEPAFASQSALVGALLADPGQAIVEKDASGDIRFGGDFRNAEELRNCLRALPATYAELLAQEGEALVAHFETVFRHHAFTGRSASFFAYEGLGSIYWHMVSKLVLAIQENALAADDAAANSAAASLQSAYYDTLEGLGMHKSPARYGAFPTDAYSHTPKHAGAQQPGMTGQVKEDILVRWGELGVVVEEGRLGFSPRLLRASEFLSEESVFAYLDLAGTPRELDLPANALAFTFCGIPVVYVRDRSSAIHLAHPDGHTTVLASTVLPADLSRSIFQRNGEVAAITVRLGTEFTFPAP